MVSICQGFLGAEYFLTNLGCLEIIIVGVRAWVKRPPTRTLILVSGCKEAEDLGNLTFIWSVFHPDGGGAFR